MGIVALKKSEHGRTLCMAVYCEETSCGTSLLNNGLGAHVLGYRLAHATRGHQLSHG